MVRHWEKLISLQEDKPLKEAKEAYQECLNDRRKSSWPSQVRYILETCGGARQWNKGRGLGLERGAVVNHARVRLESQEIRK